MAASGFERGLRMPDAARARAHAVLGRREALEREHPAVKITARRDEGGRLVFEVSEPDQAAKVYQDGEKMMDELEARYPGE
jgi:hypothetical protein